MESRRSRAVPSYWLSLHKTGTKLGAGAHARREVVGVQAPVCVRPSPRIPGSSQRHHPPPDLREKPVRGAAAVGRPGPREPDGLPGAAQGRRPQPSSRGLGDGSRGHQA